jgi:hypothetical protein
LANAPVKNVLKKCLNFSIRPSITLRDNGRVPMEGEVQRTAIYSPSSRSSFRLNKRAEILFESFEGATRFAGEVAGK